MGGGNQSVNEWGQVQGHAGRGGDSKKMHDNITRKDAVAPRSVTCAEVEVEEIFKHAEGSSLQSSSSRFSSLFFFSSFFLIGTICVRCVCACRREREKERERERERERESESERERECTHALRVCVCVCTRVYI